MIPGSNLLSQALSAVGQQAVNYYAFQQRITNSIGTDVPIYAPPVVIMGSLQAVPRSQYEMLGYDFNKHYMTFFCPQSMIDVERNTSGDVIEYANKTYQVQSITPWFNIDGWIEAHLVEIPRSVACLC